MYSFPHLENRSSLLDYRPLGMKLWLDTVFSVYQSSVQIFLVEHNGQAIKQLKVNDLKESKS